MADAIDGDTLPHRTPLLPQCHAWFVLVGSAAMAAFLACILDHGPSPEPRYRVETSDALRCLVEDGTGTFVERADGAPECVEWPAARTRIAASH